MPELPEVETIAAWLSRGKDGLPSLVGKRVLRAEVLWPRTLAQPDMESFSARIAGQQVTAVGRRGKFLLLHLRPDTLLVHLRMSGDLFLEPERSSLAKHARLVLHLEGGYRLVFDDPRKFGRAWLSAEPETILAGLGPEPLDEALTYLEFARMLQKHHRQLKPLLLDQSFLAGLGNIYSDEALHLAHLHPLTISDRLDEKQVARLLDSIRQVLRAGIQRQGASIDWVYRGGDFQNYFCVYQRTGQPCLTCGTKIVRTVIGQRSTHYCPFCQVLA